MNIKETFLKLTSQTYPHGFEHQLFDLLPQDLDMDEFGNLFTKIGDSDVMFTSHLDTATSTYCKINHVIDNNFIKTDGKSILGADDKAGVTIMLNMIENGIPGLYYFFLGEEVGCIGSKKVADKHKIEKLDYINKVISFDRRGTDSVITFQSSSRCCSEKFAEELSKELNLQDESFQYKSDPTGIYTDSAQFVSIYPECTNISVGYYSEHTYSERQDIQHLEKLVKACLKVDWKNLPVERDPKKVEYRSTGWNYDYDYYPNNNSINSFLSKSVKKETDKVIFWDEEHRYVSDITINNTTGEIISLNIHRDRVENEIILISNFLNDIELDYKSFHWDGINLELTYSSGERIKVSRTEMEEYITEMDLSQIIESDFYDTNKTLRPTESDWSSLECF